jgi:hypothetical protein
MTLRHHGDAPYKIFIAKDYFGMRGIDYRCEKVAMTLVVAKPFDSVREWLQGKNRVCIFGDAGRRVRFSDVELIDRSR